VGGGGGGGGGQLSFRATGAWLFALCPIASRGLKREHSSLVLQVHKQHMLMLPEVCPCTRRSSEDSRKEWLRLNHFCNSTAQLIEDISSDEANLAPKRMPEKDNEPSRLSLLQARKVCSCKDIACTLLITV